MAVIVAIVVDPSWPDLQELVTNMAVWAVDSPQNRAVIEGQRSIHDPTRGPNDLTLFRVQDLSDREANLLSVVDDVDLHHPHLDTLRLVGIDMTESLSRSLRDINWMVSHEHNCIVARKFAE